MQSSGSGGNIILLNAKQTPTNSHLLPSNGPIVLNKLSTVSSVSVSESSRSNAENVTIQLPSSGVTQISTVYPIQYLNTNANQEQHGSVYHSSTGHSLQYQNYANSVYGGSVAGTPQYFHAGSHLGAASNSGLIATHQGNAFIFQSVNGLSHQVGGVVPELMGDHMSLAHHTRASPLTVHWLLENYENADGVSLPRCTLYCHYLRHCQEQKIDPMNPASFGKLIRSVFMGLRTRRLGTRGNSKYHYYGIRIKPTSPLNQFVEDKALYATRNYQNMHKPGYRPTLGTHGRPTLEMQHQQAQAAAQLNASSHIGGDTGNNSFLNHSSASVGGGSLQHLQNQQTANNTGGSSMTALPDLRDVCDRAGLPSGLVNRVMGSENQHLYQRQREQKQKKDMPLEDVDEVDEDMLEEDYDDEEEEEDDGPSLSLPEGCTEQHVVQFIHLYADHCDKILHSVVNLNFHELELIWSDFWRTSEIPTPEMEDCLPRNILYSLVSYPTVQAFIAEADHSFYQSLVEVLIPDVFRLHPPTLTQAIRNFAKSLEMWMRSALKQPLKNETNDVADETRLNGTMLTTQGAGGNVHCELPSSLVHQKVASVCALAHVLRRYTSLNHLAQAACAVLKNGQHIEQMLNDLNRIDFNNIQEQVSWIFRCSDDTLLNNIELEFKRILQKQSSLDEWGKWLEQIVERVLNAPSSPPGSDNQKSTHRGQNLILQWSYYSSLVIRDLTLRSASSFGSFHLIRLLYDEYVYYLVEHKIAAKERITPIAMISAMNLQKLQRSMAVTTEENNKDAIGNDISMNLIHPAERSQVEECGDTMFSSAPATPTISSIAPPSNISTNLPSGNRGFFAMNNAPKPGASGPAVKVSARPNEEKSSSNPAPSSNSSSDTSAMAAIRGQGSAQRKTVVVTNVFEADLENSKLARAQQASSTPSVTIVRNTNISGEGNDTVRLLTTNSSNNLPLRPPHVASPAEKRLRLS